MLATPLGIAIGLFLSLLAPRGVRTVVGPLVEMLAAIPSVVLGLWGVIVLAPFVQQHFEPWLNGAFGFLPIFGSPQTTGLSVFTAGLVLTIMVVPIVASLSRVLLPSALGARHGHNPRCRAGRGGVGAADHPRQPGHRQRRAYQPAARDVGHALDHLQQPRVGGPLRAQPAWGTAFVLMALILAANVGARVFLVRNRSRLGL